MHQILPTFSHLVLLTIGALKTTFRISGEDHYCGLKSPHQSNGAGVWLNGVGPNTLTWNLALTISNLWHLFRNP